MKIAQQLLAMTVVAGALAAFGYGAYAGFEYLSGLVAALSPQLASVTAVASAVVLVAAWLVGRGMGASIRQARAAGIREEKAATYQLFVDYWCNTLQAAASGAELPAVEKADKLRMLERLLSLYGAREVVQAQLDLRGLERDQGAQRPELRARFVAALADIRKELGADSAGSMRAQVEQLLFPDLPVDGAAGAKRPPSHPVGGTLLTRGV